MKKKIAIAVCRWVMSEMESASSDIYRFWFHISRLWSAVFLFHIPWSVVFLMEPNPWGGLTSTGADQLNLAADPRLHKVRRQPGRWMEGWIHGDCWSIFFFLSDVKFTSLLVKQTIKQSVSLVVTYTRIYWNFSIKNKHCKSLLWINLFITIELL